MHTDPHIPQCHLCIHPVHTMAMELNNTSEYKVDLVDDQVSASVMWETPGKRLLVVMGTHKQGADADGAEKGQRLSNTACKGGSDLGWAGP